MLTMEVKDFILEGVRVDLEFLASKLQAPVREDDKILVCFFDGVELWRKQEVKWSLGMSIICGLMGAEFELWSLRTETSIGDPGLQIH